MPKISDAGASGGGQLPVPGNAFVREDGVVTAPPAGIALDQTASDLQPDGVASAGSTGKGADAGHAHPLQPWQFQPEAYGAKGDGKIVTDGVMSSSSNPTHLACATSTPFTAADVGKAIHVGAAGGGSYIPLCTTISGFTDSGHVVLAAAATSSITAAIVAWATDDTAAINSAKTAAIAWAQAHNGDAEILFSDRIYGVGGAPAIGGATLGNAQIPLPVIADTARKVTLTFSGPCDVAGNLHWLQTTPQATGAALMCLRNDGTTDGTYGPAAVVGGPFDGYGAESTLFNNMHVVIDGVMIVAPLNGTYMGWDFFGTASAAVINGAWQALAVIPSGGPYPCMGGVPSYYTNFTGASLRMPSGNNNDNCDILRYTVMGCVDGVAVSEHTNAFAIRAINCYNGIAVYSGVTSGGYPHRALLHYVSAENTIHPVTGNTGDESGPLKIQVLQLDTEAVDDDIVDDSANVLQGEIYYHCNNPSSEVTNGGSQVRIINTDAVPGIAGSPPAVPSSGTAQKNTFYRDAMVIITGGTVSQIAIDGTATALTSGTFMVPSGHSVTVTYSAAPSWQWVLL